MQLIASPISLITSVTLEAIIDPHYLRVTAETSLEEVVKLISPGNSSCKLPRRLPLVKNNSPEVVEQTSLSSQSSTQIKTDCVLVMEGSKLLGLLTNHDLVRFAVCGMDLLVTTAGSVIGQPLVTIRKSEFRDAFTLINLFCQHKIRYLPILNDTGQFLGVVTCESIFQMLQPHDLLRWRRVKEVMKSVLLVPATTSMLDLARLMVKHQVSCAVITQEEGFSSQEEENHPEKSPVSSCCQSQIYIGIVTEQNILQCLALELNLMETPLQTAIKSPLGNLSPDDSLWVAHQQMQQRKVQQLAVTGSKGELLGLITDKSWLDTLEPAVMYEVIQELQQEVKQLHVEKFELLQKHQTRQELQKVNQALDRSIATNRALLDAIPDSMFRIRRDGSLVNYKAAKEGELPLTNEQLVGKRLHEILPTDVADAAMTCVRQVLQTGELQTLEYQLSFNQTLHDYEARFAVSDVDEVMVIVREITERKRTERALRSSEKRFRATFEQAAVGIVHTGLDGRFLRLNQKFCDIVGYTHAELLTKTFVDITHPDDLDADKRYVEKLLAGEINTFSMEKRYYHKDGSIVWGNLTGSLVCKPSGELDYFVGVVADISIRKKTEEALQESEQKYRYLVNSVKEVIFQTDTTGKWTLLNPAWTEITGFTVEDSLGQSFFDFIHPEDKQDCQELFQQLIDCKKGYWRREIRYLNKKGGFRWVDALARLVLDEHGATIGVFGTLHDITERKQAEEELHRALAQEKELNDLKSRFVSMTSHEFRTPLTTILASTELLRYYSHKWDEDRKITHYNRIETNVQHMTNMLNDVLILGKAEAGKLEFQPILLDLIKFCLSLVEELQLSSSNQHKINFTYSGNYTDNSSTELTTKLVPTLEKLNQIVHPETTISNGKLVNEQLMAFMDEKLLRYILSNLLSNAIKYSAPSDTIDFELTCQEEKVIFKVKDQGIGIPPQDQPYLFESFHRANNVGKVPGTGLGLAIVKKAVDLHRGEITFDSQVGVGTTFTVKLPRNK
ncbi:MAG: PAS domain S-box protein [Coleofasciculaceae cyanobacterium]